MESKDKSISTMVNGYPVTFSFTEAPRMDLGKTIRRILLDSFIAQSKGLAPQSNSAKAAR